MTRLPELLDKPNRASKSSVVVAASAVADERWPQGHGTVVPDRELARRLKAQGQGKRFEVVVTGKLLPTLLRAIRTARPALVVVTGDAEPADVRSLDTDDIKAIGPRAVVRMGDGDTIACATSAGELTGLCRALGSEAIALALAPTPAWLHQWLRERPLASRAVVGTIQASALDVEWARWARQRKAPAVLIPIGLQSPPLDQPRHPGLPAAVGAHALERHTGPIFPSPRVAVAVLRGLSNGLDDDDTELDPQTQAIWAQARRALPMTGSVVGMDRPRAGPTDSATAAFLAQRALLRAQRAHALAAAAQPVHDDPDPEGVDRAEQLLAKADEILTDHESKVVLRGFSVEVTRQAVASSASGAAGFADRIGYPVVLKALSPDLRRRTDIGAIELALTSAAAVRRAYASIVDNVERRAPTARLDGVLVAEMVPLGLDVHVGVVRLPDDGGLAIYGRTIEASAPIEPAMALLPVDPQQATLLAHAILTRLPVPGLRRADDPDVHALAQLLQSVSRLAEHAADRIETITLAPARLVGERTVILDARITQRPHLEGR